ncbi:ester cyclase [Empedobacter tilapiae]|uniref:nuclear transport factor 2 family protein n=1 Tax=Empedobacter tilapiae TaxID=2491114 RepID=UPI0028D2BD30|nr:ester cyclase [Empedobacter tilapiae]
MKKIIIPIIIGSTILLSTQMVSCTNKTETSQTNVNSEIESNKEIVLKFYQQMFGDKDLRAVDKYIAPEYIQHNPTVADGSAAFKKAAEVWFKDAPKNKIDVQHIAAEGDLVFLHIKDTNLDGSLKSVIDIFRLKDGKIVEHWDVQQDVPKESANQHPMF